MSFLGYLAEGIGALSGLSGLLGGNSAADAARQQQQQAINAYQLAGNQQLQALRSQQNQGLLAQTGLGGDAIGLMGRHLGDSLAGAGVYNSSAVGGALAQAQAAQQASLANLAAQNNYNTQNLAYQNAQNVANMQYGFATQNYNQGLAQSNYSRNGLMSMLGALTQQGLAGSGVNGQRSGQPLMNGTQNQANYLLNPLPSLQQQYSGAPATGQNLMQPPSAYNLQSAYRSMRMPSYGSGYTSLTGR